MVDSEMLPPMLIQLVVRMPTVRYDGRLVHVTFNEIQ